MKYCFLVVGIGGCRAFHAGRKVTSYSFETLPCYATDFRLTLDRWLLFKLLT